MTPEAGAREKIDHKLVQTGWLVQDLKQLDLGAADLALSFPLIASKSGAGQH